MEQLICTACGANDFITEGGYRICRYCDTKYAIPNTSINSRISINSDVAELLEKCKRDPKNARRYANLVLDIDPKNREALKYI